MSQKSCFGLVEGIVYVLRQQKIDDFISVLNYKADKIFLIRLYEKTTNKPKDSTQAKFINSVKRDE